MAWAIAYTSYMSSLARVPAAVFAQSSSDRSTHQVWLGGYMILHQEMVLLSVGGIFGALSAEEDGEV